MQLHLELIDAPVVVRVDIHDQTVLADRERAEMICLREFLAITIVSRAAVERRPAAAGYDIVNPLEEKTLVIMIVGREHRHNTVLLKERHQRVLQVRVAVVILADAKNRPVKHDDNRGLLEAGIL